MLSSTLGQLSPFRASSAVLPKQGAGATLLVGCRGSTPTLVTSSLDGQGWEVVLIWRDPVEALTVAECRHSDKPLEATVTAPC